MPLSEMTTMLSIGMAPERPIGAGRPRTWKKIPADKKVKFMPLSMAEFVGAGKKAGKYKVHR
jgi:hypothetical protein